MSWFEADDVMEFFRAYKDTDPVIKRKFTFFMMVSLMSGIKPPVAPPLQSKNADSRAVEIALTYGGDEWCRGPYISPVYTKYKRKGGQRSKEEFDTAAEGVRQDGNLDDLKQDLVHVQSAVNSDLQKVYDAWQETGARDEEKKRKALLKKLRDHQKTKVGKHTKGNFWLLTNARDGKPILLISSALKTAIDNDYIEQTRTLESQTDGCAYVSGLYEQDIKKRKARFAFKKGRTTTTVLENAFKALGTARDVEIVEESVITG